MRFFTISFLLISAIAFSQDRIKHIVASGETVYSIAKKYDVKESEIFELNPKAKGSLLQLKAVLWIPNKNNSAKESRDLGTKSNEKNKSKETALTVAHEVLAKETLYGIAKKYSTTVDKLKEANPSIKGAGIKEGSKLVIPVSKEVFASQPKETKTAAPVMLPKVQNTEAVLPNTDETITHDVLAKETKYGISKRYNISIEELEKLNPQIAKGLSAGDHLIIHQGKMKETAAITVTQKEEISSNTITEVPSMSGDAISKAELLIAKASDNLGIPYRSGGTDKRGFDCSGLIFTTFQQIDMTLPRSSADMATNAGIKIDKSQAQKGDLIFFDTTNRGNISHVGMVTEVSDDEIKFIHSSTSSGVIISTTKDVYYAKRLVQINRVLF